MGQQQLLLLVLGIVIVGLAVVAGINAFSENQEKSTKDAMTAEAMRVATDLQAWRLKPEAFGGGGGTFDGANATLTAAFGTENVDSENYQTPWGNMTVTAASGATEGTIILKPSSINQSATVTVPTEGSPSVGDWATGDGGSPSN